MKRLIAALGFMLLAAPAFAKTTVNTSPIIPQSPSDVYNCTFTNTSSKPLTVLVGMTDVVGNVFASQSFPNVPPGQGGTLGIINTAGATIYCSFEFSGSSKSLRGALEMFGPGHTLILPGS
jgi:hypothetical protein